MLPHIPSETRHVLLALDNTRRGCWIISSSRRKSIEEDLGTGPQLVAWVWEIPDAEE